MLTGVGAVDPEAGCPLVLSVRVAFIFTVANKIINILHRDQCSAFGRLKLRVVQGRRDRLRRVFAGEGRSTKSLHHVASKVHHDDEVIMMDFGVFRHNMLYAKLCYMAALL